MFLSVAPNLSSVEVHVGEVKLLLALGLVHLVVLVAVIAVARLALAPSAILLGRHDDGRLEPHAADARAYHVAVECVVVDHLLVQVVGAFQVGGGQTVVVYRERRGALYLPARVEQRVGYGVLVDGYGLRRSLDAWHGVGGCLGFRALLLSGGAHGLAALKIGHRGIAYGRDHRYHD